MILTYHQAIELMSYLPMALPMVHSQLEDQSELAHLHQDQSDLQTLILNAGTIELMDEPEAVVYRQVS